MPDATSALLERVRAARQRSLPLPDNRRTLRWRLPDWQEQYRLALGGLEAFRAAAGLVEDWAGFVERDLVPPGTPGFGDAQVSFSRGALDAALAADADVMPQLIEAVLAENRRHKAAQEAASGN